MTKEELDDADEAGLKGDGAESPLVLTKFEGPFRFGDFNGSIMICLSNPDSRNKFGVCSGDSGSKF